MAQTLQYCRSGYTQALEFSILVCIKSSMGILDSQMRFNHTVIATNLIGIPLAFHTCLRPDPTLPSFQILMVAIYELSIAQLICEY